INIGTLSSPDPLKKDLKNNLVSKRRDYTNHRHLHHYQNHHGQEQYLEILSIFFSSNKYNSQQSTIQQSQKNIFNLSSRWRKSRSINVNNNNAGGLRYM